MKKKAYYLHELVESLAAADLHAIRSGLLNLDGPLRQLNDELDRSWLIPCTVYGDESGNWKWTTEISSEGNCQKDSGPLQHDHRSTETTFDNFPLSIKPLFLLDGVPANLDFPPYEATLCPIAQVELRKPVFDSFEQFEFDSMPLGATELEEGQELLTKPEAPGFEWQVDWIASRGIEIRLLTSIDYANFDGIPVYVSVEYLDDDRRQIEFNSSIRLGREASYSATSRTAWTHRLQDEHFQTPPENCQLIIKLRPINVHKIGGLSSRTNCKPAIKATEALLASCYFESFQCETKNGKVSCKVRDLGSKPYVLRVCENVGGVQSSAVPFFRQLDKMRIWNTVRDKVFFEFIEKASHDIQSQREVLIGLAEHFLDKNLDSLLEIEADSGATGLSKYFLKSFARFRNEFANYPISKGSRHSNPAGQMRDVSKPLGTTRNHIDTTPFLESFLDAMAAAGHDAIDIAAFRIKKKAISARGPEPSDKSIAGKINSEFSTSLTADNINDRIKRMSRRFFLFAVLKRSQQFSVRNPLFTSLELTRLNERISARNRSLEKAEDRKIDGFCAILGLALKSWLDCVITEDDLDLLESWLIRNRQLDDLAIEFESTCQRISERINRLGILVHAQVIEDYFESNSVSKSAPNFGKWSRELLKICVLETVDPATLKSVSTVQQIIDLFQRNSRIENWIQGITSEKTYQIKKSTIKSKQQNIEPTDSEITQFNIEIIEELQSYVNEIERAWQWMASLVPRDCARWISSGSDVVK